MAWEDEDRSVRLKQLTMGCFKIPKWPKVALSFLESLWDFWLFIFLVVCLSVTEDEGE